MKAAFLLLVTLGGCGQSPQQSYERRLECAVKIEAGIVMLQTAGNETSNLDARAAVIKARSMEDFRAAGKAFGKTEANMEADRRQAFTALGRGLVGTDGKGSVEAAEALRDESIECMGQYGEGAS